MQKGVLSKLVLHTNSTYVFMEPTHTVLTDKKFPTKMFHPLLPISFKFLSAQQGSILWKLEFQNQGKIITYIKLPCFHIFSSTPFVAIRKEKKKKYSSQLIKATHHNSKLYLHISKRWNSVIINSNFKHQALSMYFKVFYQFYLEEINWMVH